MKKFLILISSLLIIGSSNSCSERELDLYPPSLDDIKEINSEDKLQKFLNSGYLTMASVNVFGADATALGDVLSDNLYVTGAKAYVLTSNMNYSALNNDTGSLYRSLYDAIMNCNLVINNTQVSNSPNVTRMKAEAQILRGFAYFTLVNYFSPTPTSGINQEFGVPIVLGDYDSSIEPARATVAEVYTQIIADLTAGLANADDTPTEKVFMSKTAAKLLLSRVYLTRRDAGDALLALQYSTDIVNNSPPTFAPIAKANYVNYWMGAPEDASENQPETIWELDLNPNSNQVSGIGPNLALPTLYNRISGDRRALLFTKDFFDSFPHTDLPSIPPPASNPTAPGTPQSLSPDVRRGDTKTTAPAKPAGLLSTLTLPATDNPAGAWTNKYPRLTGSGNFMRNIKVLRFAEAQLNRIEALFLTGQSPVALLELNAFAVSRGGSTYTGADLLSDILTEKAKEFYGEGQRFLDLKRNNLPLIKNSNCVQNCNVPANDKLFVMPISQSSLNYNPNLKQYPGY